MGGFSTHRSRDWHPVFLEQLIFVLEMCSSAVSHCNFDLIMLTCLSGSCVLIGVFRLR